MKSLQKGKSNISNTTLNVHTVQWLENFILSLFYFHF